MWIFDGGDGGEPGGEVLDSREEVDAYALGSQMRAKEGWASGAYKDEITPVPIPNRKTRQTDQWAADEHMRPRPRQPPWPNCRLTSNRTVSSPRAMLPEYATARPPW